MSANVVPFERKPASIAERGDDDLMLLAAAGARGAFEELVRRHAGRLFGFCVKHCADRNVGEEMAQELWLSVWAHRKEYRPEGKFVVWLFTLARNRLRNAARDGSRRPGSLAFDDAAQEGLDPKDLSPNDLDRLIAHERQVRVARALASVPQNLREAVVLRFGEELPYEDVARILDTNESTARSRVFHGLRELRRRLRGES